MALTRAGGSVAISAIKVTGSAIAYTVPVGKTATVRLVYFDTLRTNYSVYFGNYRVVNMTTQTLSSINQSNNTSGASDSLGLPIPSFVRGGSSVGFQNYYIYIKEEHDLVAGETVLTNDATATFAYTIYEKDA